MIKISTRGQYALLIMIELADQNLEKYVPLKNLAATLKLSVKYLEQILIQLSKSGLVTALRGNNGGYKLAKPSNQYTAGEILRSLEGNLSPRGNTEELGVSNSGYDEFWNDFETAINNYVDSVTLESLVEKKNQNDGYMYYI